MFEYALRSLAIDIEHLPIEVASSYIQVLIHVSLRIWN